LYKLRVKIKSKLKLSAGFKEHAKVVDRINSLNLSWKAENYEQFADMTIEDLNHFTGKNRSKKKENTMFSSIMNNLKNENKHPSVDKLNQSNGKERYLFNSFNLMRFREKDDTNIPSIFDNFDLKPHKNNLKKNLKKDKSKEISKLGELILDTNNNSIKHKYKSEENVVEDAERDNDFKDLPKNFLKWKKYVSPPASQVDNNYNDCIYHNIRVLVVLAMLFLH